MVESINYYLSLNKSKFHFTVDAEEVHSGTEVVDDYLAVVRAAGHDSTLEVKYFDPAVWRNPFHKEIMLGGAGPGFEAFQGIGGC